MDTQPAYTEADEESSFSFRDYVRLVLESPDLTDAEADHVLWELTPFPMVQGAIDLAPYLARVRAERAKAEALREAADFWADDPDAVDDETPADCRNWLRDRADEIEAGK